MIFALTNSDAYECSSRNSTVSFEVREEAVGVGQSDSTARYGIGESTGRADGVLEDDYGIAVKPERFTDIVSGVDPSKFAGGSGRIGEEVKRRGFGYGASAGKSGSATSGVGNNTNDVSRENLMVYFFFCLLHKLTIFYI